MNNWSINQFVSWSYYHEHVMSLTCRPLRRTQKVPGYIPAVTANLKSNDREAVDTVINHSKTGVEPPQVHLRQWTLSVQNTDIKNQRLLLTFRELKVSHCLLRQVLTLFDRSTDKQFILWLNF
jgi:hypothetical protein